MGKRSGGGQRCKFFSGVALFAPCSCSFAPAVKGRSIPRQGASPGWCEVTGSCKSNARGVAAPASPSGTGGTPVPPGGRRTPGAIPDMICCFACCGERRHPWGHHPWGQVLSYNLTRTPKKEAIPRSTSGRGLTCNLRPDPVTSNGLRSRRFPGRKPPRAWSDKPTLARLGTCRVVTEPPDSRPLPARWLRPPRPLPPCCPLAASGPKYRRKSRRFPPILCPCGAGELGLVLGRGGPPPQARTTGRPIAPKAGLRAWGPPCGPEQRERTSQAKPSRNFCLPRRGPDLRTGRPPCPRRARAKRHRRTSHAIVARREGELRGEAGQLLPPSMRAKRSSMREATVCGAEAGKAFRRSPQQAKQQIMRGRRPRRSFSGRQAW